MCTARCFPHRCVLFHLRLHSSAATMLLPCLFTAATSAARRLLVFSLLCLLPRGFSPVGADSFSCDVDLSRLCLLLSLPRGLRLGGLNLSEAGDVLSISSALPLGLTSLLLWRLPRAGVLLVDKLLGRSLRTKRATPARSLSSSSLQQCRSSLRW